MSGVTQAVFMNQRSFATPPGQACFSSTSTACYTWTAPAGVTKISVLLIGRGGNGGAACRYTQTFCCPCGGPPITAYISNGGGGGGGGATGWKNNYCVTPGSTYKISFISTGGSNVTLYNPGCAVIVRVQNGTNGGTRTGGVGGNTSTGTCQKYNGGTGGTGGCYYAYCGYGPTGGGGGGGSGGYSGAGVIGGNACLAGTAGSGSPGSGGGGVAGSKGGGGGGGIGKYGTTTGVCSGAAGASGGGGGGNSRGGCNGITTSSVTGGDGGAFGGGGGGGSFSTSPLAGQGGTGGAALVRIIWPGCARLYPGTRTANE
jgi:hypothetical protein